MFPGIGSEEDSLQNVLRLVPKAPKQDFNQFVRNDGKVLRFTASLEPRPGATSVDTAIDHDRRYSFSSC